MQFKIKLFSPQIFTVSLHFYHIEKMSTDDEISKLINIVFININFKII